jgi:ribose transport system ATP-binding protein
MKRGETLTRDEVLRIENATLRENGAEILSAFNLNVYSGEIVGLISPDGRGKSELIKLILENSELYYGRVFFMGRLVNGYGRVSFLGANAALIDKERRLVENLTVADNIFVLRKGFRKFIIDQKTLYAQIKPFSEQFSIRLTGNEIVGQLSAIERRAVEIIRAKVAGARLLIVENVNDVDGDLKRFCGMLKRFVSDGSAVLYVSGRRGESLEVCDRIAVMEGGRLLGIRDNGETIENYFPDFTDYKASSEKKTPPARSCLGSETRFAFSGKSESPEPNIIAAFDDVSSGQLSGLSFKIKAGESLAILDPAALIFDDVIGIIKGRLPEKGEASFPAASREFKKNNWVEFILDNPAKKNLFPDFGYLDNLCFSLGNKKAFLWRDLRFRKSVAREYEGLIGEDIYARDISNLGAESLYKLAYLKALLSGPKLVVCLQPFLNADMYLRRLISRLIRMLTASGAAVLVLISALSDSLTVADRLVVVKEGKALREYDAGELEKLKI